MKKKKNKICKTKKRPEPEGSWPLKNWGAGYSEGFALPSKCLFTLQFTTIFGYLSNHILDAGYKTSVKLGCL